MTKNTTIIINNEKLQQLNDKFNFKILLKCCMNIIVLGCFASMKHCGLTFHSQILQESKGLLHSINCAIFPSF